MKIYVITDVGVEIFKNFADVKRSHAFEKEDFVQMGKDYVLKTDLASYEVSKDIKLLERVASEKVFTKTSFQMSDWLVLLTFIMALLIYIK